MFKKIVASFATLLLAVGMSVVAIAAPASATPPGGGTYPPTDAAANDPDNWEILPGEVCYKIDPVKQVPYPLPAPGAGLRFSKVIVKAGSGDGSNLILTDNLAQGALVEHNLKDSISHLIVCTVPIPPATGTNSVDCTAATIYTGTALANHDHINMNVSQNGGPTFQLNAAVDIKQSPQDDGVTSESNLVLRIHQKTGPDITLGLTNAQVASGSFAFTYSAYLTGKWTVQWVQFNSSYFNQDNTSINYIQCGSDLADAAASVSKTLATCTAAETLVLGTTTFADFGGVTGAYSVTAAAQTGHKFAPDTTAGVSVSSDGKTKTFTGTLAPKLTTGCADQPKCLPSSAVSYTYAPGTNDGVITVVNPDPTKYSNDLCQGFWVTAASWYYTTDSVWPQVRNQLNPLPKITSVGTYSYGAPVVCGQGDIYASFTEAPAPTYNLYGPNDPFKEKFLHDMGFPNSTKGTTYTQTMTGCNKADVVVPTAKAITTCGTYGSISVPTDTEKIDYTVTGAGLVGIYTVTAVAKVPYVLKGYPAGGWEFDLKSFYDCERTLTLTYVPACSPDSTNDWTVYNPGADNITVSYPGGTILAVAGQYTPISTPASDDAFTITWGATGSGIKPGTASATPGADLSTDDPTCLRTPVVSEESNESFECTDPNVTITTVTYSQGWVYESGKWVPGEKVVTGTVVTHRDKTADDITEAGCLITVTDPVASTCENLTEDTDFTSWIKVLIDPNVAYTIDGAPVTESYNEVTPGVQHTVVATALNGYTLVSASPEPDSWTDTVHTWKFTSKDSAVDCIPTQPLIDLEGSFATGVCLSDSPWIFYEVTMIDPANLATSHSAKLILTDDTDPTKTATIPLGDLVETSPGVWTLGGTPDDKVLWPGASVDPVTGVATGWPGWEQQTDGTWVTTDGNFAWSRDITTATLSVNPQLEVHLEYPEATPNCDSGPPEPPTLATVTPAFSSTPLTCSAAGSYTLGELTPGTIDWTVNGKPVGVGTYPVTSNQTLTFVAAPKNPLDGLDPDWVAPTPVVFSTGAAPCDLTTLALTGATAPYGLIWVALLLGLTGVGFILIRRRTSAGK